jgi:hypothetical protein
MPEEDENVMLVRRWMGECFDRKNLAVVDEIVVAEFIRHAPGGQIALRGREQVKGFPQWHDSTFHGASTQRQFSQGG